MIDLYGMGSPNVLKIVLMLEELELPYRFHQVNIWQGEQFSDEFRHRNPNAKVPVIVDSEGPEGKPYTVFESGAILFYLAEKTGRLLPQKGSRRYDAMQWLMIQLTGVGPMFGQFVHFTRFAPTPIEYAQSRYRTEVLRICDLIEARLAQSAYLGGSDYTIADVATYPWIRASKRNGFLSFEQHPSVQRWMGTIEKRPASERLETKAAEIAKAGEAHRAAASADDLDRVFGRGRYARTA